MSILQKYAAYICLSLLFGSLAHAEFYLAPLDEAGWQVDKSAISCRLRQSVPRYGAAIFEKLAGNQPRFYTQVEQNPMQSGPATLVANAPSWNPARSAQTLGNIEVVEGRQPIALDEPQAQRLMQALRDGLVPELARPAVGNADKEIRIGLSPVNFRRAAERYEQCLAQLLPFSFAQIAETSLQFEREQVEIDKAARKKIDLLLRYLKADRRPVKIDIAALSDDRFRRLENLELAKQRTQRVNDYLVERGIEQQAIATAYRTERGGKDISKRYVTIHLRRVAATLHTADSKGLMK